MGVASSGGFDVGSCGAVRETVGLPPGDGGAGSAVGPEGAGAG
ncbi:hypothetical protein [Streptomyces koelreuteriae]